MKAVPIGLAVQLLVGTTLAAGVYILIRTIQGEDEQVTPAPITIHELAKTGIGRSDSGSPMLPSPSICLQGGSENEVDGTMGDTTT